ncbi:MAG TPA: TonB family protein [Candidatus Polarisedimenticolia bacterium]|nr:TonB family protein [Candidatus Polarisedimenticolia bacterium]
MPVPLLTPPSLVSGPIDFRRLRRRIGSLACAAASLSGLLAGLVLVELVTVASTLPPRAVTSSIFFPKRPPSLPSLPGHRGGANTPVPPKLQPVPRRLEAVPVPPPLTDAELPPPTTSANEREHGSGDALDGTPGAGDGLGGVESNCDGCGPGIGDGTGRGDGPGSGDEGPVTEATPGLEPPVVIPSTRAHPDYPDIARKARVTGSVLLLIVIDKDGRVGSIEVLQAPDARFGFEMAAIEAVKRWRYRPARLGGRPVAVQASVRIEFTLAR